MSPAGLMLNVPSTDFRFFVANRAFTKADCSAFPLRPPLSFARVVNPNSADA